MESSYIGAYWGSRRESAFECGQRLARCIAALVSADPVLGSWFRRGASKAAAKTPVGLDETALGELLAQGRNRRDFDGEVIEDLGFSVGLWNRGRPAVGMSGTVGAHPPSRGVLNSFVLELPPPDEEGARLYQPETAAAIFEAVLEAWEPDWATWTTHSLCNAQAAAPREPDVGWLTYLRDGAVQETPRGTVRSLGGGVLIQAAPELAAADEATVLAVRQQLQQVGALQPIP